MYKFGDIVLLEFPFISGLGSKKRPALVIIDANDGDVVVARITSRIVNTDFDVIINDWRAAGLLTPSIVRLHKIVTLELSLVNRKIGELSTATLQNVRQHILDIAADL